MVQETGDNWIFGITSMFGIAIIGIVVIGLALTVYLVPTLLNVVNNDSVGGAIDDPTKVFINNAYSLFMSFLRLLPLILFLAIVIFMIVVAIRKQAESRFE